jgi:hypothetical protein
MRKLQPQRTFVDDFPNLTELEITTDCTNGIALLKKWASQDGWTSLQETVESNTRRLAIWYG